MKTIEIEDSNIGKPTNPTIQINPEFASSDTPQSWEHSGEWYYNWEGAMQEAKFLGKRLPMNDEWQ